MSRKWTRNKQKNMLLFPAGKSLLKKNHQWCQDILSWGDHQQPLATITQLVWDLDVWRGMFLSKRSQWKWDDSPRYFCWINFSNIIPVCLYMVPNMCQILCTSPLYVDLSLGSTPISPSSCCDPQLSLGLMANSKPTPRRCSMTFDISSEPPKTPKKTLDF